MKLSYTVSLEDVVLFNLEYIKALPESIKVVKRNRLILPIIYGVVGCGILLWQPQHWLMSAFVILLGAGWYFFYPRVWERKTARALKKHLKKREDLQLGGQHVLKIKDDSFEVKNDNRSVNIHWDEVRRSVINKNYVYLFLTEQDAIIIPRERIKEEIAWEEICKFF